MRPFSPSSIAHKLLPEWGSHGVFSQITSRKATQQGTRNLYLSYGRRCACERNCQSHTLQCIFSFQKRKQIPFQVSIAVASICHSPKVTVDKGRWTHHHELSNSVHFWHVTYSVVTLPLCTQSWGKHEMLCYCTDMTKSMCMVLTGWQLDYPGVTCLSTLVLSHFYS